MSIYTIGELSRLSGVKTTTIRFYESRGLLPKPDRSEGGQRRFDQPAADCLLFIRHSRELGFDLDSIGEMLALKDKNPTHPCARAHVIARAQLSEVERKIAALKALHSELERIVSHGDEGIVDDCKVISALQDHTTCMHEIHLPIE